MARKRIRRTNDDASSPCRTTSVGATEMEVVQHAEAVVALGSLVEQLHRAMGRENDAIGREPRVFATESVLLSALADVVSDILVTNDLPQDLYWLFCSRLIDGVTSERYVARGAWRP